jgi:glycosyltransferase involved in cell wall biosynthesis
MTKILQICAIDRSVESLLLPLILRLAKEGYTVHTACADTGRFSRLRELGLTLWDIPFKRKISPLSNLQSIGSLYQLMKKEKYDMVHVHTPIAAVLGRIAARLVRAPHVLYTAHGYYFHEGMGGGEYLFYHTLEKWCARYLTHYLLLQSREDYELSLSEGFQQQERIIHIGNGVDVTGRFDPERITADKILGVKVSLGIAPGELVICYVGRMVAEKGIFELLDAFRRLEGEFPAVRLLLVGDISASERDQRGHDLMRLCSENPRIVLTGFRTDIPELLAVSDIFVLPSHREGLPRSIIEAMAMAKPIVATNIRGCREEVTDGVNGLLVEAKQADDLYMALKKLVQDEEKRAMYGRNSRMIAERHFNEQDVLARQLNLFGSLRELDPNRREAQERIGQDGRIGHIP